MRLIYTATKKEVQIGDKVALQGGGEATVKYFIPPVSACSSGRVGVEYETGPPHEYYVGVIGATWVEREDRKETA